MRWLLFTVLVFALAGCKSGSETPPEASQPLAASGSESAGGPTPFPTAVPNAPVLNSESMEGGGSGAVGQVMKNKAKETAAKATGGSSLDQLGSEAGDGG